MDKRIVGLCLFIVFAISSIGIIPQSAYATSTTLTIKFPATNQMIAGSYTTISGTYSSPDANRQVVVSIDGSSSDNAFMNSGSWSYSTQELKSGWHVATASLFDSNGWKKTSVQFLINSGHVKTTKYNVLFIVYSEGCSTILKHKGQTDCPPLSKLVPFDTTNGTYAGRFVNGSDGLYRTNPQVKNFWVFFDQYKNRIICVDCKYDYGHINNAQMIFIVSTVPQYSEHSFANVITANSSPDSTIHINENSASLTIHKDRFVTPDCMIADIKYSEFLLTDTIGYMNSGCTITKYNETSNIVAPNHSVDPTKSYTWQVNQFMAKEKSISTKDCRYVKCDIKSVGKKW